MARPVTEAQRRARRKYNHKPSSIRQRDRNNKARRLMEKLGKAHKGDGKDVAHLDNDTTDEKLSNLQLQSRAKNRSFDRTAKGHRAKKAKPKKRRK